MKKFLETSGIVLIKAESCDSCFYFTFCMEYVWKSLIWIAGLFQRATKRPRIQLTDNKQNGGRFSVNYYQCCDLGHHFFILGSSHGKHFRYSRLVSQYTLLICAQWLFSVFGKLRSRGPSSVSALEARRKGRRSFVPLSPFADFCAIPFLENRTPDRKLGFWTTRLFVLVPRTSVFFAGGN